MHNARFMGVRKALRYGNEDRRPGYGYYHLEPTIYTYYKSLPYNAWTDDNLIYEGQLDDPPLIEGQMIYLHTLKESVKVESILRSTDGTYTYKTEYEIEKIEDECTAKSKAHAELRYEHWKKNYKEPVRSVPMKLSWWKRLWN